MDIINGFEYNRLAQFRALLEVTVSNSMDYGIISLLLIQLGAVMGSIAAYIRMRTQTDAVKTMRDSSNSKCADIELRVEKFAAMFTEREAKMAKVAGDVENLKDGQTTLEKRLSRFEDAEENNKQAIRSIKAGMSAFSRHLRKPAPETDEPEDDAPNTEQIDAFSPPLDKPARRGDFGKAAV